MKIQCRIEIKYNDRKKANMVLRSIKVDDFDFVESKTCGTKLKAIINSGSISSLIHTLDDYLACISVAEKIVDKN
ncbi:MAG: hypothetical protein DRN08_01345 [Thermoplasmata archaeon]|nr:MAG: hypothetical protein DRN05_04935 [Thermoplasmata archaeon]RLF36422.1 MAG: hypothetical protein DRN08_01345 [Thermoplasmata archaeon]